MAEFKPVSPPVYVFDVNGAAHTVYGWWVHKDWETVEPVVANPDGGISRWSVIHGNDPWTVS